MNKTQKLSLILCLSLISIVASAEDIWVRVEEYLFSDPAKAAAVNSKVNTSLCLSACIKAGMARGVTLSAARDPNGMGIVYENRGPVGGRTGYCKCVQAAKTSEKRSQ